MGTFFFFFILNSNSSQSRYQVCHSVSLLLSLVCPFLFRLTLCCCELFVHDKYRTHAILYRRHTAVKRKANAAVATSISKKKTNTKLVAPIAWQPVICQHCNCTLRLYTCTPLFTYIVVVVVVAFIFCTFFLLYFLLYHKIVFIY